MEGIFKTCPRRNNITKDDRTLRQYMNFFVVTLSDEPLAWLITLSGSLRTNKC